MKESRPKLMILVVIMIVAVFAFVSAVDYFFGINNIPFTILVGWMLYKIVKREVAPVRARKTGGFALFNDRGEPCVLLGEPRGNAEGDWYIILRDPASRNEVLLCARPGELLLQVRTGDEVEWGLLTAKSIDKMIDLGILHKPGRDGGGDTPDRPNDPVTPKQEDPPRSWIDTFLYVLAA